ncbi:hypothetical protein DASC09_024250 [Saccharomycopsis crataegensis]|uniref:Uncharacterized protein n=1 Tax=Saccharomycopsis crataegensis TaxID=43959 RepID=A0AAV5QKQ7_9ASCO|nr:hypothetical protein DASC09_024250 [Saccharomycopsis crataegensis]
MTYSTLEAMKTSILFERTIREMQRQNLKLDSLHKTISSLFRHTAKTSTEFANMIELQNTASTAITSLSDSFCAFCDEIQGELTLKNLHAHVTSNADKLQTTLNNHDEEQDAWFALLQKLFDELSGVSNTNRDTLVKTLMKEFKSHRNVMLNRTLDLSGQMKLKLTDMMKGKEVDQQSLLSIKDAVQHAQASSKTKLDKLLQADVLTDVKTSVQVIFSRYVKTDITSGLDDITKLLEENRKKLESFNIENIQSMMDEMQAKFSKVAVNVTASDPPQPQIPVDVSKTNASGKDLPPSPVSLASEATKNGSVHTGSTSSVENFRSGSTSSRGRTPTNPQLPQGPLPLPQPPQPMNQTLLDPKIAVINGSQLRQLRSILPRTYLDVLQRLTPHVSSFIITSLRSITEYDTMINLRQIINSFGHRQFSSYDNPYRVNGLKFDTVENGRLFLIEFIRIMIAKNVKLGDWCSALLEQIPVEIRYRCCQISQQCSSLFVLVVGYLLSRHPYANLALKDTQDFYKLNEQVNEDVHTFLTWILNCLQQSMYLKDTIKLFKQVVYRLIQSYSLRHLEPFLKMNTLVDVELHL